jgi:beta-N-acetylhexosaminidase
LQKTLAALAALLLVAACREAESPWTDERLERMTLRERAAQLVVPAVPTDRPEGDSALAAALAAKGVGGVRLLDGSAAVAAARVEALQAASALPLLVLAEVDRGAGGGFDGATELPQAAALAPRLPRGFAAAAAREMRELGINLALLDAPPPPAPGGLPFPAGGEETGFGRYLEALAEEGILVGVRAFGAGVAPGDGLPVVAWDGAAVRALHQDPLRGWIRGGAAAIAPAQVAIPALTRDSVPLPANPVLVRGTLRRDLGFAGLVVAELPPGSPLVRAHGEGAAAVRAVAAGADLVAGIADAGAVIDSLVAAVESGRISAAAVEASLRRVFAAKEAAGLGRGTDGSPVRPAAGQRAAAVPGTAAREAHRDALLVLGRPPAEVLRGCRAVVLVTRPGAGAGALSAALSESLPGLAHLETGRLALRGPLTAPGVPFTAAGAPCVVAASFPHAPLETVARIVPVDTALAGADTLPRRVVWIEFLPAPGAAVPTASSLVVARGTGAAAQQAAAAAVAGDAAGPPEGTVWPPAPMLRLLPPDSAGMRGDSLAAIDRRVREALAEGVFSAAAVAVGRRGVLVKLTGYGSVGGRPVEPAATVFDIASLTKVVGTTSAAMVAVEEGMLELDAPVRRQLSGFRGDGRERVTVRHLLTHTSGLPAGAWLYGGTPGPDQALARVQRSRLVTPPGERSVYSDFGMILLAAAIERAAAEPLDRLLARRVFGPLGMASTGYLPALELQPGVVPTLATSERPYPLDAVVHDGNAFRLGGVAGHAGLFSTAADLAVFAQTLLNGGAYGTQRVFQPGTVAEFTRMQPNAGTRALGWDTPAPLTSAGSYFSARSFGHTGYTGTSLWIDPESGLFVVLLTNRTYTKGSASDILNLRARVADLAALSIADREVRPRAGSVVARRLEAARRPPPRRRR